ncbi:MAG: hypothetical protein M1324_00725 [Patescibacteria group bacterium]|nr:hypothetical protein [Patescibacteria group bacterium]
MEAVINSFRPALMDLARRAIRGDENVAVCLIGYTSANIAIADQLHELYEICAKEVEQEQSVAA